MHFESHRFSCISQQVIRLLNKVLASIGKKTWIKNWKAKSKYVCRKFEIDGNFGRDTHIHPSRQNHKKVEDEKGMAKKFSWGTSCMLKWAEFFSWLIWHPLTICTYIKVEISFFFSKLVSRFWKWSRLYLRLLKERQHGITLLQKRNTKLPSLRSFPYIEIGYFAS